MKTRLVCIPALLAVVLLPAVALAHCQVPCGIYNDTARIEAMREDTRTIGKAVVKIKELAGAADAGSENQLTRWVMNKETHASHIVTTMAEYFLTQRVKPVAAEAEGHDAYLIRLAEHHAVIVAAMKTKQDASPETVKNLFVAIEAIAKYYEAEK